MKNYKHKKENKAIVSLFVRVLVISHDAGVGVDMISLTVILDLMTR